MRRFALLLTIFLLISTQFNVLSIGEHINSDDKNFNVTLNEKSTLSKAIVNIAAINPNITEAIITLPEDSEFSKGDSNKLSNYFSEITYDELNHSVVVQPDKDNRLEINLVLKDLSESSQTINVKGVINEESTETEEYTFFIKQDNDLEIGSSENKDLDHTDTDSKGAEIDGKNNKELLKKEKSEKTNEVEGENTRATPAEDISNETVGDLNTSFEINPVFENALSGADADFRLTLKLTGSKRTYKNVTVTVQLPDVDYVTFDESAENLIHLDIGGVVPTYDPETNELKYQFNELKRGQMYEKIISLRTENGYIPNDTPIEVTGKIYGEIHYTENDEKEEAEKGDVVPFEIEDSGEMVMEASGAMSLSKFRVETEDGSFKYGNNSIVSRGDQVRWRLELEIPKKNRGQLFLNPEEKIVITDTLPVGLEYVGSLDEPVSVDGQTITWEFTPDDFETQNEMTNTLFTKDIEILTSVRNNASIGELTNNAAVTATFIESSEVTDQASRGIRVAEDDPASDEVTGQVLVPNHIGPDPTSNTGLGTVDVKNPRPSVTDDVHLRFSFTVGPLPQSFPDSNGQNLGPPKNYRQYDVVYDVDENLMLEEFKAPGPFEFRPNNAYPAGELFGVQPQYAIKGIVDGVERTLVPAAEVITDYMYTREALGLDRDEHLSQITLEFQNGYKGIQRDVAPGGLRAVNRAELEFSIKEDARGWVENKYKVVGTDGNGGSFVHEETNADERDLSGPRQANIIDYEPNDDPVGRVSVKLLEDVRGVVTLGNNRMQVELANVNNSGAPMSSSLETVVLLPPGVTLHDDVNPTYTNRYDQVTENASYEILANDHNGSGRQLVKISWDDSRMTKGENVTAELDVYIADHAPNQLVFDVYGFSYNENLKAPSTTGGITDTILQDDLDNFYGEGTSHPRLKSGNRYTLASKYDIQTEKLIKGPNDEGYSKFTTARYEETVDYKLKMTNTTGDDISMMTLIDVLPSVGDLGITDNVQRGSQFTPTLEGSITLPASWQGKVKVFYSTAKNPERDELTRHTNWLPNTPKLTNPDGAETPNWMSESEVTDWSAIHSFKIELGRGDTWIEGQDIEIDFSMKMPSEANIDSENAKNCDIAHHQRAAWNSFAVATDVGQPVEPERVGVAIECDPPETPDIEKSVENNEGEFVKDLVEKARNQTYNYRIDTTIPEDLMGFEYVAIADELDEKLEIVETVALVDDEAAEYDIQVTDQLVTLRLEREELDDIAGKQLTLQITAKIKPGVEIEVIDNDATIQVNDNPSKDSNIVKVEPVEGSLTIIKVDDADNDPLEGATFELYLCEAADSLIENCEQSIREGVTGLDGKVTFENLDPGYYQLVETKAPEGYRLLTTPVQVKIEATELDIEIEIENTKSGWELPHTGGIGTTVFYVLGSLLMLGSIIFFIRWKKSGN